MAAITMALVLACGDDGGIMDESGSTVTAPTSDSTGHDTSQTAGDPCAGLELPPCDFCPSSMSILCGLPCGEPGQSCSNDIGDGMECVDGTWQCVVHPPLGEGCNLVCTTADQCTEIGCDDGVTIELRPDADGVTAGSYVVSIEADGVLEMCDLEISDDPAVCLGGPPCVPDTTCNVLVGFGGSDPVLTIPIAIAAEVTVSVQRDAEPPVELAAQPIYDVDAPNGPGCGPACAFDSIEVAAL
jgi:hypothetical protein